MSQSNENSKGHGTPIEDAHEQSSLYDPGSGGLSKYTETHYHHSILSGLPEIEQQSGTNVKHSDFRVGYVSKITAKVLGDADFSALLEQDEITEEQWDIFVGERSTNTTNAAYRLPFSIDETQTWTPPTLEEDTGSVQPSNPLTVNVPFCRTIEFEVHFEDMGYMFENARRYDSLLFEWFIEPTGNNNRQAIPLTTSTGSLPGSHAFTSRFLFPYPAENLSWSVKLKISDPFNNHDNFFGFGNATTWKIADVISKPISSPVVDWRIGDGKPVVCSNDDTVNVDVYSMISGLDKCNLGKDVDWNIRRRIYQENVSDPRVDEKVLILDESPTAPSVDEGEYKDRVLEGLPIVASSTANFSLALSYDVTLTGKLYGREWSYTVPIDTPERMVTFSRPPGGVDSVVLSEQGYTVPDDEWLRASRFRSITEMVSDATDQPKLPGYIVNAEQDSTTTIQIASEWFNSSTTVDVVKYSLDPGIGNKPWELSTHLIGVPIDENRVLRKSLNKIWQYKELVIDANSVFLTVRSSNVEVDGEILKGGCTIQSSPVDVIFVTPQQDIMKQIDNLKPELQTGWDGATTIHISWTGLDDVKYTGLLPYAFPIDYKIKAIKWENSTATVVDEFDVDSSETQVTISSSSNSSVYNKLDTNVEYYFEVCPVFRGSDNWHSTLAKETACMEDDHWSICGIRQVRTSSIVISNCSSCIDSSGNYPGISLTSSTGRDWSCGRIEYFYGNSIENTAVDNRYWLRGGKISQLAYADESGNVHFPFPSTGPREEEEKQVLEIQLEVSGGTEIRCVTAVKGDYSNIFSTKTNTMTGGLFRRNGNYYISYGTTGVTILENEAIDDGNILINYKPVNLIQDDILGYRVTKISGRGIVSIYGGGWDESSGWKNVIATINDTANIDQQSSKDKITERNGDVYRFIISAIVAPRAYRQGKPIY